MLAPAPQQVDLEELIELCAIDSELFCRTFFAETFRQASPAIHREAWALLESEHRYVNIQMARDFAKTTLLRAYTAKRIAYALAHTILYIGKSEGHAIRSVDWPRSQIQYNRPFSGAFGLFPGKKWQDTKMEILHKGEGENRKIVVLGMGITGSVRGINEEGRRPDLIVIDDVIGDDNAATPEQRQKIEDLILGALKNSLAPATEVPDAKIVMLQTPLDKEDASCKALQDPEWESLVFGCWTKATMGLPIEQQRSAWPARWPDATLRAEKTAAIQRNKLSIWLKEKECILTSPETSSFREDWLQFWTVLPERMQIVIVIDPVPPPSDIQIKKGLKGKDYEAFAVVGLHSGRYFLLEYAVQRGHEPDWTIAEFFRLAEKYKPRAIVVESVAYQRTLAWLLRNAMRVRRRYFVVKEYTDKRKKFDRILDGLSGPAAAGQFYVNRAHTDFIEQFRTYPSVSHDDLIEAVAIGISELSGANYDLVDADYTVEDERDIPPLQYALGAP